MRLLWIVCFIFFSFTILAQEPYLYLNKIGRTTKVKFYEQEPIRLKLKGDDYFVSGKITGFEKDAIKISKVSVQLEKIESIDIRDKNFSMFSFRSTPGKLAFAGYGYTAIDWFNRRVVAGEKGAGIDTRVAAVSTGLIGLGYIVKALQKKYFKIGPRNIITVIDTAYEIEI